MLQQRFFRILPVMLLPLCFPGLAQDQSPNILWITVEDLSPRLASYGDRTAATPNLDRLSQEGVRYTNAFSVAGVCAPSRASIITGLYPTSFGALHMRTLSRTASIDQVTDPVALAIPVYEAVPPPQVKCFTEYLRAAGYYCTNNSKTDYQFHAPRGAWDESSSEAHWRNRPKGAPFFAVFNLTTTHESQVWLRAQEDLHVRPEDVTLPPYYPDTPIVRRDLAIHYSNLVRADAQIGRILRDLEEDGLLEQTTIFFFSDHGDGLPRSKRWIYDSGIHVPFLVRHPNRKDAGSVIDDLVSFVDLAPTLLSLAGLTPPEYLPGRPFLGRHRRESPDFIFASKDRMDPAVDTARAVRDRRFKYIRNFRPEKPFVQFIPYRDQMPLMQELLRMNVEGGLNSIQALWFRSTKPPEELYDLESDPHEIRNLAADPAFEEKLFIMRKELDEWIASTGDPLTLPEDELVRRLWPPDGHQPTTQDPRLVTDRLPSGEVRITIACETDGASLSFRLNNGRWRLYTGPFVVRGKFTVAAEAHRIGFKPSDTVELSLD